MSLVAQSTLVNTYLAKLIATILKALREQLKETAQLNAVEEIAGPVPEIPLEYDQILIEKGTMSMENICQKISCRLPDVKRLRGYFLKVFFEFVPMQECKICRHEVVGSDLGGHRQVGGPR